MLRPNVSSIGCLAAGTPFDPEFHEAIMREPNNEVPDGTVLQEFRKGFKIGDKLLRPAMVQVQAPLAMATLRAGTKCSAVGAMCTSVALISTAACLVLHTCMKHGTIAAGGGWVICCGNTPLDRYCVCTCAGFHERCAGSSRGA